MKKQILIRLSMMLAAVLLPLASGGAACAWGPERPTYTMESPADHATFNSMTDNAAVGDERDFVRIAEVGGGKPYSNSVEIEAGKDYEVYIYYHNDASETYNTKEHNYKGVARDTRLSSGFPTELKAGETGDVVGIISSSTTSPEKVWDEAKITAKEDVTLHYVLASAKISNDWGASGRGLSTNLFSQKGTFIGLNELDGIILGCDKYSGYVVYTIRAVAVDTPTPPDVDPDPGTPEVPDTPEPEPEKPNPDDVVPDEIPSTGPAEVVLAIILVILVVCGGVYWAATHRMVTKVTKNAKGRKKK